MNKKFIYSLLALGVTSFSINAVAQDQVPDVDVPPPPDYTPELNDLDEDSLDAIKEELESLRDELEASRDAVLDALPDEATIEEKLAALEQWRQENNLTIEAVQGLAQQLRESLREIVGRPGKPEWVRNMQAAREELQNRRRALNEDRQAVIEALGEDATEEEIEASVAAWREENQAEFEAIREESRMIQETFKAERPERPGFAMSQELRDEVQKRKEQFKETAQALKAARDQIREIMSNKDLTREEREAEIAAIRERNNQMVNDLKDLRREQRSGAGELGGERRGPTE